MIRISPLTAAALGCLVLGLAACGGGDGGVPVAANVNTTGSPGGDSTGSGTGNTSGTPSGGFLGIVASIVGNNSDTAQPVAIDAVEVTTSETALPDPVS